MGDKKYIAIIFIILFVWMVSACVGRSGNMQNVSSAVLTQNDKAGLMHMAEEEKLAHDVYQFLYEKWQMPVFKRIIRSETKHIQAVERLVARYNLKNPMEGQKSGSFSLPSIQKLYDKLTAEGSKSKIDALKVAATIEDLDIYDLQNYIRQTDNTMIKRVYNNLMRGSRNHMRAFIGALKDLGGLYTPQYISKSLFEKIISTPIERGKKRDKSGLS